MECCIKLKDWQSQIGITGILKYDTTIERNIHPTYLILDTVNR